MKRICALLAAILLIAGLSGCTNENPPAESPTESVAESSASIAEPEPEPSEPDSVFVPGSPSDPEAVKEAAAWVKEQTEKINDTGIAIPDASGFSDRFRAGNAAYKDGDFDLASTIYTEILADCPTHHGAINNLALTYIQMEEYEQALRYCILNRVHNPGFYAGWINLQVAGHALGFRPSDLMELLDEEFTDFPKLADYQTEIESDFPEQGIWDSAIMVAYLYNALYADMEYDAILDDETTMNLEAAIAAGELTEAAFEQQKLELYMNHLEASMQSMAEKHPEDADIQLLREYLTALRKLRERQQE